MTIAAAVTSAAIGACSPSGGGTGAGRDRGWRARWRGGGRNVRPGRRITLAGGAAGGSAPVGGAICRRSFGGHGGRNVAFAGDLDGPDLS